MLQDNRRRNATTGGQLPPVALDRCQAGLATALAASSILLPLAAASPDAAGAGPGGWQFAYGPDPGPRGTQRLTELCIDGVAPAALVGVLVLRRGQVVFQLGSGRDARGQTIPAGEMLQAMAAMQGRTGLVIDAAHLDLAPVSTLLRLQVSGDTGPALPQVTAVLARVPRDQSAS
jgi:hypothetical protein